LCSRASRALVQSAQAAAHPGSRRGSQDHIAASEPNQAGGSCERSIIMLTAGTISAKLYLSIQSLTCPQKD
jgi:hypothetical protein